MERDDSSSTSKRTKQTRPIAQIQPPGGRNARKRRAKGMKEQSSISSVIIYESRCEPRLETLDNNARPSLSDRCAEQILDYTERRENGRFIRKRKSRIPPAFPQVAIHIAERKLSRAP